MARRDVSGLDSCPFVLCKDTVDMWAYTVTAKPCHDDHMDATLLEDIAQLFLFLRWDLVLFPRIDSSLICSPG